MKRGSTEKVKREGQIMRYLGIKIELNIRQIFKGIKLIRCNNIYRE
jgi:hypothetical protein